MEEREREREKRNQSRETHRRGRREGRLREEERLSNSEEWDGGVGGIDGDGWWGREKRGAPPGSRDSSGPWVRAARGAAGRASE